MRAIAPGKLILTGEHSVVYGAPAVAIACQNYVEAQFQPSEQMAVRWHSDGESAELTYPELSSLIERLDHRFAEFEQGERDVSALLDAPVQLLWYVLGQCRLNTGGELTTRSTLPTGAGMGSSAAAIAATLLAVQQSAAGSLSQADRFAMVRFCERLQHGKGSAIDAAAVTFGGLVRVQDDQVGRVDQTLGSGWYRVNTGRPSVSTGQCVQQVRDGFASSDIWSEFADVSNQLQSCLSQPSELMNAIRVNHRLLNTIGVVPVAVAEFIDALEAKGAAAKISGAGAIAGCRGGQVLVYSPEWSPQTLVQAYGYTLEPLVEDREGARVLRD